MKSKFITVIAIATLTLAAAGTIYAQTGTSTTPRGQFREERKDLREQGKADIKGIRLQASTTRKEIASSTRAKIEEKQQEMRKTVLGQKLQKYTVKIDNRFEAAIERLENIATRTETRIAKLSAEGVNEATAKANLAIAKTKIAAAKTKVAALNAAIEEKMKLTDAKSAITGVKALIKAANDSIKEAHRALSVTVSSIKPGLNKPKATSTPVIVGTSTATSTQ